MILNALRYVWGLYDYYTKFKSGSDFQLRDELLTIARFRNMNGIVVETRGELGFSSIHVSTKNATLDKPQATLDAFFDSSWREVCSKYPRRHWYYQMEKRMINYQKS